jgi:phosphoglycerate dehydrogenase-like enzyme
VIGNKDRFEKYSDSAECAKHDIAYVPIGSSDDTILSVGKDAEIIILDAMGIVSENVINHMSSLKMIHSEGVGFQGVDVEAARKKTYMCAIARVRTLRLSQNIRLC